jgi:hypothetical protein
MATTNGRVFTRFREDKGRERPSLPTSSRAAVPKNTQPVMVVSGTMD